MATPTLNISPTPELRALVNDQVRSGRFSSASEVVRASLRLLQNNGIPLEEMAGIALADGHYQLDRQWRITAINDVALGYLGCTREAAVGATLWSLAPGLLGTECEAHYRSGMAGERQEFTGPSAVRPGRWLEARVFPTASGVDVVLRDITERLQTEAALAESERRLDLAVRAHGIGIFDWSVQTGAVGWSDQEQRIFGLLPGEFEETIEGWAKRVHPEDLARVVGRLKSAMDGGQDVTDFDFRIVRPNGEVRHLEGSARVIYDAVGRAERMIGVNFDVTERRANEAALRESEARLRTLSDNLPFAMLYQIAVPPDHGSRRFLHVSKACQFLNGVSPEEALADADALYRLIAPEDLDRLAAAEARSLENGLPFDIEVRFQLHDGSVRWFRLISAPRDGEDGGTIWDGLQMDVTDRHRLEEARSLLMREVDHRARNALAVVQSVVQLTPANDVEQYKETVIGRVASLARAQASLAAERWQGASLRDVLEAELQSLAASDRYQVFGPDLELFPEQVQPLSMITHELATNAVKHGALGYPGGKVVVSWATTLEGATQIIWEESGRGVAAPPARMGFGSRLIRQLAQQLGAVLHMEWRPKGLMVQLRFQAALRSRATSLGGA